MIVTLLSAILTLVVLPETIHVDDCHEFYRLCTEHDVYPNCKIIEQNDLVCYIATYPFDWEEDEQLKAIMPIYAAGIVSRATSWHSDYVVVDFNNVTMTFPTAMARELFAMANLGYSDQELGSFFLEYADEYSSFNINYLSSPPPCTPMYSPIWRLVEEFDSQTACHPNQASCQSNLRSLATAESMYYGMYNRYGTINELVSSDIMANAGDLECPTCGRHYSVTILDDGNSYRIDCPNSDSHGSIVDGICSWGDSHTSGLAFNLELLNALLDTIPHYSPIRDDLMDLRSMYENAVCQSNLRSLATAEAMHYGSYNRYGTINELVSSDIMANAGDLECPACGEPYAVTVTEDSYKICCPNHGSHGSIEDGIVSWQ